MIEDRIAFPPELFARGIGDGAAATLRRELKTEGRYMRDFAVIVDPTMPADEIHVYHQGERVLEIKNIGGTLLSMPPAAVCLRTQRAFVGNPKDCPFVACCQLSK